MTPTAAGHEFALVLILASRHRGLNEAWLAKAIERTAPDGLIVMAGGKTDGISSLRKRLARDGTVSGHLSKNHGEVFWLRRGAALDAWAATVASQQAGLPLIDGRFRTAPGMFSHDRIDAGSKLLAGCLPAGLSGVAADFCAGWGYLSVALVERASAVGGVDLYEADYDSLEAARMNLAALAPHMSAGFHWLDLTAEAVDRRYDVIVMNPPFHAGRAADPAIGNAMIRAAGKALKAGGQLFMVANRGLPYEPTLRSALARVEQLVDDQGFTVWRARR